MLQFDLFHKIHWKTSLLERGKFQKSSSRIYGAHTMVFQAQISNFIEFGPEMAQRNGAEVCSTRVINENQSCPGKVMA